MHHQRNMDISYRPKIVSETISGMAKTVSNVSMFMMQKTVNMLNIYGETREIIWMSPPLAVTLIGRMNA